MKLPTPVPTPVPTLKISNRVFVALSAVAVLMAGCDTATPRPTSTPAVENTATPLPTEAPAATPVPPPAVPNATGVNLSVPATIAQSIAAKIQAAVPRTDGLAFGGAAPTHVLVTFDGDQLTGSPRERQVRVYPVEGLRAIDPIVAKEIDKLKVLLAKKPETIEGELPLLPFQPSSQVFHAQVKYVDFAGGSGVRYITGYSHDVTPITNEMVFYTFQGLTSDGKYYISAFYPIRSTALPNTFDESPAKQNPEIFNDAKKFEKYLADAAAGLNSLPTDQFAPDLSQLDTMLQSLSATPALPDEATMPAAQDVITVTVQPKAAAKDQTPTLSADAAKPAGNANVRSLVNVRAGASTRTRALAQLRRNTQVQLLGRDAGARWIYVEYGEGKKGWVASSFLRSEVVLRTLPIIK